MDQVRKNPDDEPKTLVTADAVKLELERVGEDEKVIKVRSHSMADHTIVKGRELVIRMSDTNQVVVIDRQRRGR